MPDVILYLLVFLELDTRVVYKIIVTDVFISLHHRTWDLQQEDWKAERANQDVARRELQNLA